MDDLYGRNAAALDKLTRDVQGIPEAEATPITPEQPTLPPFNALWKTADEPIDWTEALASPTPTDGLTPPDKWALYHQQAAGVLHGDTSAYEKVLEATAPAGDLLPYVAALDVTIPDSNTLRAVFAPRPDLLENEPRRYLSGMALRIARDLFAALPVTAVTVEAKHEGRALLTVDFDRQELNKVRFSFVEPVEFVVKCGGTFSKSIL